MESVRLKPGRDKAVRNRHHWIFSGAVERLPDFEDGALLPVVSSSGEALGWAYFNRRTSIMGRMVSFGDRPPEAALRENIRRALELRRRLFDRHVTNAYRLINAEGDGLPGLVADLYDDVLIIQVTTLGMEKLKPMVLGMLAELVKPRAIIERSDTPSRREEGLEDLRAVHLGEDVENVLILEEGLIFKVGLKDSQKTGFYLDQREMRKLVGRLARGRTLLNAFSYTGSFAVHAAKGGARRADSVDYSEKAIALAKESFELNSLAAEAGFFFVADVFNFLRQPGLDYDFIVLDPPAFAKRKSDVMAACRGYKDINRLAIRQVRPGGLIITCSCSHFVDEALFQKVVFEAAAEAGRSVKIIQKHRQALDHPVNIFHPETAYLKGFLLSVD
jgi:23S rRNA (cytosine1962-C5)-methyltransferase